MGALKKKTGVAYAVNAVLVVILFVVLLFATNKWKKHPIFYIVLSAIVGIVFAL